MYIRQMVYCKHGVFHCGTMPANSNTLTYGRSQLANLEANYTRVNMESSTVDSISIFCC